MNKSYEETSWNSYKTGKLCKGCEQCVQGKKLVLFITGLCPRKCFYCPISSEKYAHDEIYANEWKIKNPKKPEELFEEAKMTGAKGAGITGGDPLIKITRTCEYIKQLKKKLGKNFHIHLYTSLDLVTEEKLKKLYKAGLDEIRFHPDLENDKNWKKIELAKKFSWKTGVEIPVIPGKQKQTEKLINFLKNKIHFLNLNELELSDTDTNHYDMTKYKRKNNTSYGVKGSQELALKLLKKCSQLKMNAHYCTAKLKNQVQVGERLKRRAKNTKLETDELTNEYLLMRGAIYIRGHEPGFKYEQGKNQEQKTKQLTKIKKELITKKIFKEKELTIDKERNRLITHYELIQKKAKELKKLNLVPAITEEYPSSDYFCVELEFL